MADPRGWIDKARNGGIGVISRGHLSEGDLKPKAFKAPNVSQFQEDPLGRLFFQRDVLSKVRHRVKCLSVCRFSKSSESVLLFKFHP